MGFPSPATDYIESTLTVNSLCNITANSRVIPTDRGYVVLEKENRFRVMPWMMLQLSG